MCRLVAHSKGARACLRFRRRGQEMQSENSTERAKDLILDASLGHAPFDGWSALTFQAALADSGVAAGLGAALFPRGGIDLAVAYHLRGDAAMRETYDRIDKAGLRIRDRIALAVRLRLQVADKELVARIGAVRPAQSCAGRQPPDLGQRRC